MFNDISIGPVTIHMYGLMIAIGFLAAYVMCDYRGKKQKLDEDRIFGIFICAIVGGLLGTKILYYIVDLPRIIENPSILLDFQNGFVVYGGIIGGVFTSYVYCKRKKIDFLTYFDLVMPAVAMAQGFGRLGCFFAGCCYGRETDAWFGIVFSHSSFAPNGVRLLPTQLMSSAGDFLFCVILLLYANRKHITGRVGTMYMILYGVGRFIIEFFRNDYRGSVGFLSTSQMISIGIVIAGIVMYLVIPRFSSRKKQPPQETADISRTGELAKKEK